MDDSNGKRPIDIELLDAYLARAENTLMTRSGLHTLIVHPKISYYLPSTATDKPKSQRKCLPTWNLLSRGDKPIILVYLQIETSVSGKRMK